MQRVFFVVVISIFGFLSTQSSSAAPINFTAIGSQVDYQDMEIGLDGSFRVYSNGSGVWVSNNHGASYTRTLTLTANYVYLGASSSRQYLVAGGTSFVNSTTLRNVGTALYYSSDYGATWTIKNSGYTKAWSDFAISDDGQKILATTNCTTGKDSEGYRVCTTNGGAFYSSDGGDTFVTSKEIAQVTTGPTEFDDLDMAHDGSLMFLSAGGTGTFRSTDGSTWSVSNSDGFAVLQASATGQYVYGSRYGLTARNSNYGIGSWTTVTTIPSNILSKVMEVSNDGQFVLIGENTTGIYQSEDAGVNFSKTKVNGFAGNSNIIMSGFGLVMNGNATYFLINGDNGYYGAKTVPNKVTGVTASNPGDGTISLSWSAPTANQGTISNYKIFYTAWPMSNVYNWQEYVRSADTATSVSLTGLEKGTAFGLRVGAVNSYGVGEYSDLVEQSASAPPDSVTAVSATPKNASVTLAWTVPVLDGGSYVTDYKIRYRTGSGSWTEILTGTRNESTTVTSLTNGVAYEFEIIAVNYWGDGATYALSSPVTPRTTPSAPQNLSATQGNQVIDLEWDAPASNGGSAISDYKVEYSSNSGSTWSVFARTASSATSQTVSGLINGSQYLFRVSAINEAGTSVATTSVAATPSTTPSAPTSLLPTASNQEVSLSFTAGANGGSAISDYLVEYSTDGGSTWSTYTHTATTSSPIVITGLTNYVNHIFRLSGVNANGTGAASSQTNAVKPMGQLTSISLTRNSVGTTVGATFSTQPRVSLLDQNSGVLLSDSTTVVSATISAGASLIGTTQATAIAGIASFSDLGIVGTAGTTYTITYSAAGMTAVTQSITPTAGVATKLYVFRASSGTQTGTTFTTQPIIRVVDRGNNTITSHPNTIITASVNNSNCFLTSSVDSATATSGSATFSSLGLIAGSGTQCLVTYSATSLTSVGETITVTSGPASSISRTTRPDSGFYGRAFGQQPVYVITDMGGNTVTTDNTTVLTVTTPNNSGSTIFQESMTAVNGVVTFTSLGFSGINAGTFVLFRVSTTAFSNTYSDSIMIVKGDPVLAWSNSTKLSGASAYTVTAPTSNAAGTFSYTSSNTGVASVSGSTITVVGQGNTTLTATLTPTDTTNFNSNVSVTSTLTVTAGAATISISLAGGVVTVAKGTTINITASVNAAGKVKFMVNGKVIGGCAAKSATTSATCSWKPTTQGQSATLTAILNPTSSSYSNAKSNTLNVGVGRRTGTR